MEDVDSRPAPAVSPDSIESYMYPIWRECMQASCQAVIDHLNWMSYGGTTPPGPVIDFQVNRTQCLPLGGYQGYRPVPSSNTDYMNGSFTKESTMGYYVAEGWDYAKQQKIPCEVGTTWIDAAAKGFKIRYSIMWERNGRFRAKSGVLDVYDP